MEYSTQMACARKGIVTPHWKTVAEKEKMSVEALMALDVKARLPFGKHVAPGLEPGRGRPHLPHRQINVILACPRTPIPRQAA